MQRVFSAGGIVFNDNGDILITQNSANKNWCLPKGHIEEGQTSQEAALREVREEGGVVAEIVKKIGDAKYFPVVDGERYFKLVTYFLMNYISGNPKDHDWEVSEAYWISPNEALKKLDYSHEKKMLKKALELRDGK